MEMKNMVVIKNLPSNIVEEAWVVIKPEVKNKEKEFIKPNFGIAVGKRLGNAVVRNKFKRQFRNIVDNNRFLFKNNRNYIIMIKREANNASYNDLQNDLVKALRKENHEK